MWPNKLSRQFLYSIVLLIIACWEILRLEDNHWLLILLLLFCAGMLYVMKSKISKNLQDITSGLQAVSKGEYNAKVWIGSPPEFNHLAQAFNAMSGRLERSHRHLNQEIDNHHAILSSMLEGVIAIDKEEKILMINQSARKILHLEKKELIGESLVEGIRISQLQFFLRRVLNSAQTQRDEFKLYSPKECAFNITGTPLLDNQGAKIGALAVLNDVTDLQRLNELRKRFVADASHELKTPITNILGYIETLQDGALEDKEQAQYFLDIVGRQTERLNLLIEDLLTLSRLENEEQKIRLQPMMLMPVLEKVLSDYQIPALDKQIELKLIPLGNCPVIIGNEHLLESALNNLLDNAIKYNNQGGKVEILPEIEGEFLKINIIDNGIGIPETSLPHVFERFYRVDKGRSHQIKGTGLGLSIVKHIIIVHKGRVEVRSELGRGATFSLYLPIREG
ncbi:MAG: PAS domain-containing protein [Candidatus Schekmanbacteria bacterium]|nr:PAS domain-containing protein [Candidatus Schekmanbacteria bacterium]